MGTFGKTFRVTSNTDQMAKQFRDMKKAIQTQVTKQWRKEAAPLVIKAIKKRVSVGLSPIKGWGRYAQYSDGYKDQMKSGSFNPVNSWNKKERPVNLRLSGEMMKGLTHIQKKTGFRLQFAGKDSKKANWNSSEGVGRQKVRRPILPKKGTGEKFVNDITDIMKSRLKRIIKSVIKKARRKT